ncbi:MAG: hypothetical protein ABJA87_00120 [bacterium]
MQFSLFGAEVAEPTRLDLDGLVLAGGWWVQAGQGSDHRARLSILVDAEWRVSALLEEFGRRDLPGEQAPAEAELLAVRTGFRSDLVAPAQRWTRGALVAPPADLALTPAGLRLWAIAAGHGDDVGYLLGTASVQSRTHLAAGAQLAALGLPAVGIGERGRPGWRITGLKRLHRCAELLGEPPAGAGRNWPA